MSMARRRCLLLLTLINCPHTFASVFASVVPPACWTPNATRVLVAFVSDTGRTAALADQVAAGAQTVATTCVWRVDVSGIDVSRVDVDRVDVSKASAEIVRDADAIIVGSPVHNANPASRILAWMERWPFKGGPLRDKIGAAFVTAGGISAGEETTQLALLHAMLEFGMVVMGGADWRSAFGAAAIHGEAPFAAAATDEHFNEKARALGARVALFAARQRGNATVAIQNESVGKLKSP